MNIQKSSTQKAEATPSRINEILGALIAKTPKSTGALRQTGVSPIRRSQKQFFTPGEYNGRGSPD
jgi:hypothetical protein